VVVVRRIGAFSLGKVMSILYALLGLIFGAFFALFSLLGAAIGVANSQSSDAVASLLFGAGSVIFLAIFYGILGFVLGLITALLYDLGGWLVGGIRLDSEETQRPSSTRYQP
jgi:hypothetical protein